MYKWLVVIIIFVLIACKGPSSVPSSILGYDEMKGIMWDMAQVDEFATVYVHGTPEKVKHENLLMYQKVFVLHKISNDEFTKSYSFYKTHPIQQKILMDSLIQFSNRQRLDRYIPAPVPTKLLRLINPAPIPIGINTNDWHQFQIQTNFWYEQNGT